MKTTFQIAVAAATITLMNVMTPAAMARTAQRTGFNFGTSVRVLDNNESTLAGLGSDRNTKVTSGSEQVTPYLGYAFDNFNLGLSMSAETKETVTHEATTDGSLVYDRTERVSDKGLAVFARYDFGSVFFFELGGGLFEEDLKVDQETKNPNGDGSFTGRDDGYEVKGVGPGYHLAGGMELPMGGGFFFTSQYQVRMVSLRDMSTGGELGKKRSTAQKREALFGIAYYAK